MIAALIAGGLAYYWRSSTATSTAGPVVSVQTVAASVGDVSLTIRLNGTIEAQNEATILAPRIQGSRTDVNRGGSASMTNNRQAMAVGGGAGGPQGFGAQQMNDFSLILTKLAPAGSRVKKGDVIAQFDTQAQQQRLDDYQDSLIQSEANIKNQMASMSSQKESHLQQVRAGRASWQNAILNQQTNEVVSAINAQLFDVAVEQTKAQYDQLVYEDDLLDQQQRARIQAIELSRDQSQLELQRTKANLAKMTMTAPMDGFVVMNSIVRNNEFGTVREGDQVRSGQPFMFVVDPSSMVLNATVNQVDAERLRLGMKARIRLDAYNDIEVPGTVQGISAMAQASTFRAAYVGEIPVRVSLDKMDPRIIPDLTASAEVFVQAEENAVMLPRGAVFQDNASKYVFLRNPEGQWTRQPVETGVMGFTNVAIHSGVKKGDVVALQRPM
ncbi:MAG TPA: HlyD family efflux transporter periplasmic adaptor subunit [Bryobacteraceae bacterium]|nr:HlyD family efflux transporter periplasmic adaptor subunit [Bryobacteraceae bacterium]